MNKKTHPFKCLSIVKWNARGRNYERKKLNRKFNLQLKVQCGSNTANDIFRLYRCVLFLSYLKCNLNLLQSIDWTIVYDTHTFNSIIIKLVYLFIFVKIFIYVRISMGEKKNFHSFFKITSTCAKSNVAHEHKMFSPKN